MALSRSDDDLHQTTADAPALEAAIAGARRALAALPDDDGPMAARLTGYLGEALRILGRFPAAIAAQRSAIALVPGLAHHRARLVYGLRLAETLRSAGDPVQAEASFRAGLAATLDDSDLASHEDFALQHLGKCLLDQGRLDEAAAMLERALTIRRRAGNPALIASTQAALALLARRRERSSPPEHATR